MSSVLHTTAVFGMGRAGGIHLRNAIGNYRCRIKYVVDLRVDDAEELLASLNQTDIEVVSPVDCEKVFEDESVKSVIICTPTHLHEEYVIRALKSGKGVFCEKPVAKDIESVKKCFDLAAEKGLPLFTSFNRRFDPAFSEVYKKARANDIGELQVIKTCARDSPLPPIAYLDTSGGIFHDCLVHDIDLACWVGGCWPTQVFAIAHCHNQEIKAMDDVDTVASVMKFPNGLIAMTDISRDSRYGYDQRLEVYGSEGVLVSENLRKTAVRTENITGAHLPRIFNSFFDRYHDSYVNSLNGFLDILEGKASVGVTKETNVMVSRIATLLEESSRTGKSMDVPPYSD